MRGASSFDGVQAFTARGDNKRTAIPEDRQPKRLCLTSAITVSWRLRLGAAMGTSAGTSWTYAIDTGMIMSTRRPMDLHSEICD